MRGVADRQDGEHVQPFERTMTHSSAGRLDLNQEIGFALFVRLGARFSMLADKALWAPSHTNWTQAIAFRARRPSRASPGLDA